MLQRNVLGFGLLVQPMHHPAHHMQILLRDVEEVPPGRILRQSDLRSARRTSKMMLSWPMKG